MDSLVGKRFSLISKSEIRYVGTLHEINAEAQTIALEDVYSFGTEDRPAQTFMAPSPQKYEYIVFKGTDVKDIKEEAEQEQNKPEPPQPPQDPAILNSSRPDQPQAAPGPTPHQRQPPFPPPGYPPQGQYGGFYPPPPAHFGRGYGPPPPGGYGFNPYGPPPPGYYGPPSQPFQQGPNRFPPQQQPPAPIGPPGQKPPPPPPSSMQPAPPAAPATTTKQTSELPSKEAASKEAKKESTPLQGPEVTSTPKTTGTPQPQSTTIPPPQQVPVAKIPPTGPKKTTPAVPFTVNQRSFVPPTTTQRPTTTNGTSSSLKPAHQARSEMEEASRQAKEAVAAAMAKLQPQNTASAPAPPSAPAPSNVEALAQQVSQLNTSSAPSRGRGSHRGGRGQRQTSTGQKPKMEIPQSDFDFESANAKFNKEDLVKEAIATGSPAADNVEDPVSASAAAHNGTPARKDSLSAAAAPLYNKKASFFDDISSDAKDREEEKDVKVDGRAMRGQEFRKNVETFGQGNVDNGFRGRGRGAHRGRGRGQNNGYRGRSRGGGSAQASTVVQN